jgi:hypothetical protein
MLFMHNVVGTVGANAEYDLKANSGHELKGLVAATILDTAANTFLTILSWTDSSLSAGEIALKAGGEIIKCGTALTGLTLLVEAVPVASYQGYGDNPKG